MPINLANFQNGIYKIGATAVVPDNINGAHRAYNLATLRADQVVAPTNQQYGQLTPGGQQPNVIQFHAENNLGPAPIHTIHWEEIGFNLNVAGDTVYLPFEADEITSVVLPANPGPITSFFTDNLSGCTVFIDRVAGTNDLILYHANALQFSPTELQSATQPLFQHPNAPGHLAGLHAAATADHPAAVNVAELNKADYMQPVAAEMQRKHGQSRRDLHLYAVTVVAGFVAAGHWQFWFQTWGYLSYRRPKKSPKSWGLPQWMNGKGVFGNRDRTPSADDYLMYGGGPRRFYP